CFFFFSSRRRHTRSDRDWSSDVCSSDLGDNQIQLRLTDANGQRVRDLTITVPAAGTMQDLLDALNNNSTGVGLYGQFSLDANGQIGRASCRERVEIAEWGDAEKRKRRNN